MSRGKYRTERLIQTEKIENLQMVGCGLVIKLGNYLEDIGVCLHSVLHHDVGSTLKSVFQYLVFYLLSLLSKFWEAGSACLKTSIIHTLIILYKNIQVQLHKRPMFSRIMITESQSINPTNVI